MFRVLLVDEDNVRMSTFVRKKTGSFEEGRAFYEFTENEDLPYCRKVIRMPVGKVNTYWLQLNGIKFLFKYIIAIANVYTFCLICPSILSY